MEKGNARKMFEKRFDGNSRLGKISKLGFAPILWCIIFLLLVTYIHSVIMAPTLPKLTAGGALFAWLGVFVATSGLVMFYRCSSFGFLFLALLCGSLAGCCINIHRLICISSRDNFLIRLKSKIKDLESENELLRTQRVVVEHVANSDQADSALKQIENGYQVHEDVKTEEVQQVTKVEQQITKDSYPPSSLTKQRSLTDKQQASSKNI